MDSSRKQSGRGRGRGGRGRGKINPVKTKIPIGPISPDITELTSQGPSAKKDPPAPEKTDTMATRSSTRRGRGRLNLALNLAPQEISKSPQVTFLDSDVAALDLMHIETQKRLKEASFKPTLKCLEDTPKTDFVPSPIMYGNAINPASKMIIKMKMMDEVQKDEILAQVCREACNVPAERKMPPSTVPGFTSQVLNESLKSVSTKHTQTGDSLEKMLESSEVDPEAVERATTGLHNVLLAVMLQDLQRDNIRLEEQLCYSSNKYHTLVAMVNAPEMPVSDSLTPESVANSPPVLSPQQKFVNDDGYTFRTNYNLPVFVERGDPAGVYSTEASVYDYMYQGDPDPFHGRTPIPADAIYTLPPRLHLPSEQDGNRI